MAGSTPPPTQANPTPTLRTARLPTAAASSRACSLTRTSEAPTGGVKPTGGHVKPTGGEIKPTGTYPQPSGHPVLEHGDKPEWSGPAKYGSHNW